MIIDCVDTVELFHLDYYIQNKEDRWSATFKINYSSKSSYTATQQQIILTRLNHLPKYYTYTACIQWKVLHILGKTLIYWMGDGKKSLPYV